MRFTSDRVTAQNDLRLAVEAWDPDGDPITLRTSWWVDGRPLESDATVLPREHFERGSRLRAEVVATDGSDASDPFPTPEVVVENAAPVITTFPTGFDATGSFVYPIRAVDPDGDLDLEFELIEGPDGMRIEAHEGTLSWRPRPDQAGRHPVHLGVHDGHGGHEALRFELRVSDSPAALADSG